MIRLPKTASGIIPAANVASVSLLDMVLALALAFGIGLFILLVYKKTFSGVMYSSSFGVT